MDSGRLFFNSSSGGGNMLFLGSGDPFFRGSVMNLEDPSKRKSIFGSPEELFDDEYYDEQLPEKKRRLTPEQVHLLEKSFQAENKLEQERKTQLAKKLGLQPRQVAVWFQNRRARWKTKQLERDYDQLKSSYDSLLSTYDSVARENEKLKSEILCLSKKLEQQNNDDSGGEPVLPGDDHDHDHHLPVPTAGTPPDLLINVKVVEDRVSTGSGESGVVDEVELEGSHHQLVDSTGDSYLISDDGDYHNNPVAGCDRSEDEDIGSDDGRNNYFPAAVFEDHDNNNNHGGEGESIGWWVWS